MGKLSVKPGFKVMLMGSREEDIAEASQAPENMPDVINDLRIEEDEEEEAEIEKAEIYLAKIAKRVREYKIEELNPPRNKKKLLVLDIDYTLFDHKSVGSSGAELTRPYLHQFLARAYVNYDIVIWSATGMKWITEKMKLLGVSDNPRYKIAFYLDSLAMISVHTRKYNFVDVKPLGVIWGRYEQYSARNTIMLDDIKRNFIMNPQSGLQIKPFRRARINRGKDRELLRLSYYLEQIAKLDDFRRLNHRLWEYYLPKENGESRRKGKNEDDNPDA